MTIAIRGPHGVITLNLRNTVRSVGCLFSFSKQTDETTVRLLPLNFLVDFSDEGVGKGGPASAGLSGATVARLRVALTKQIEHPDGADPELARVLRQIVTEARNRHIRAEQLVVILKNVWDSLPEARYAIDREAQAHVRQHLITLCIRAYYGA